MYIVRSLVFTAYLNSRLGTLAITRYNRSTQTYHHPEWTTPTFDVQSGLDKTSYGNVKFEVNETGKINKFPEI